MEPPCNFWSIWSDEHVPKRINFIPKSPFLCLKVFHFELCTSEICDIIIKKSDYGKSAIADRSISITRYL
jgi:hypothetical protein